MKCCGRIGSGTALKTVETYYLTGVLKSCTYLWITKITLSTCLNRIRTQYTNFAMVGYK